MHTKNYLLVLGLAALVSACGGGSSSEGTQGGSGNGGGAVETADKTKIKFDAVVTSNYCTNGVEKPLANVAVVLHTADGKIHSKYATDSNGHFEINWPAGVTHVTTYWKNESDVYFLKTGVALAHGDLGKVEYGNNDKTTCSCKNVVIDSSDLAATMPEYKLYHSYAGGTSSGRLGAPQQTVMACADASNKYGVLQLMLAPLNAGQSYSREIDIATVADNSTIKININDFKQHGRVLTITSNLPITNTSTYTDGAIGRDFYMRRTASIDVPQRLFERGTQTQYLFAASAGSSDLPQGGLFYFSGRRIQLDPTVSTVNVPLPDNRIALTTGVVKLFNDLQTNNSTPVDFSNLNNYQTMDMYLFASNFVWSLHGTSKLTIPDLELPAEVQNSLQGGTISAFDLELTHYNPAWSFGTIQQKQATASRGDASTQAAKDLSVNSSEFLELLVNP